MSEQKRACSNCGRAGVRLSRTLCGRCSYEKTAHSEAILDRYREPAHFFLERERRGNRGAGFLRGAKADPAIGFGGKEARDR
jgi:hypothetical protein